ncbi:MAG: bis(5'-nucleosyl)-tetraphosphatase (symmetrical) YqeK [Endomicrobium sp.]|jgi:nicotinate-nucleotide adenylyltransferase|nr:bis(5'-nucleosyl)-tetraphosphatase (symmetrical) YqeK [Endomicrobium sp.]
MNTDIDEEIFEYLSLHLNPKRLEHSYNVANLAVLLAEKNGVNALKAWLAGLLHDCAKSMTDKELVKFFKNRKKNFKYFKEISANSPHLLHSFAGEIIAREYFKIKDESVLKAIKYHTLGRENMSILERLIFVSDSISHDRKWNHAGALREMAKENLNKAFFEVLVQKIAYVIRNSGWLCPQTIDTWNWYVSNVKKN